MLARRAVVIWARNFSKTGAMKVLSPGFSLEKEWAARHSELAKLGLGGDYEWISAVQKKFIGGGHASAVDVDAAVCIAEQKDQVDDALELLYKIRHSPRASEVAPSSEYAIIRLLLKYQPDIIFTLANDPINYGIFLDEHSSCLVIDHFLKANNVQGAARIASWIMQQEEMGNELLNNLCLYACAKWAELPADQQTMPLPEPVDEDVNEDDIRTFKFPYLKNEHYDEHFDLENPHHLAGKTLMWVARETKTIGDDLRKDLQLLGAVLFEKFIQAETIASQKVNRNVAKIVVDKLQPKEEGAEPTEAAKKILEKLGEIKDVNEKKISEIILEHIEKIREKEEKTLCQNQIQHFEKWNNRRHELAKAQAEKVLIKIRKEEIEDELRNLDKMEEQMNFFKNRLRLEKQAAENIEIENEARERNKNTMVA